jgi:hypothetical protein
MAPAMSSRRSRGTFGSIGPVVRIRDHGYRVRFERPIMVGEPFHLVVGALIRAIGPGSSLIIARVESRQRVAHGHGVAPAMMKNTLGRLRNGEAPSA